VNRRERLAYSNSVADTPVHHHTDNGIDHVCLRRPPGAKVHRGLSDRPSPDPSNGGATGREDVKAIGRLFKARRFINDRTIST
jgi:hypothetical protein